MLLFRATCPLLTLTRRAQERFHHLAPTGTPQHQLLPSSQKIHLCEKLMRAKCTLLACVLGVGTVWDEEAFSTVVLMGQSLGHVHRKWMMPSASTSFTEHFTAGAGAAAQCIKPPSAWQRSHLTPRYFCFPSSSLIMLLGKQ